MTDDVFAEPGDPGELKGSLRAADLINLPLLVRVTGEGEWPAKAEHTDDQGVKHRAQAASPYVECDVAVLGASGIEDHSAGVRISWRRVVPAQLNMDKAGKWIPCRPKQQDDRSIILMGFDEKGKATARALLPEVEALFGQTVEEKVADAFGATEVPPGEEPF